MSESDFHQLVDFAALTCLEHQLQLADTIGELDWWLDLERGLIRFTPDQGEPIEFPAQLIGSAAEGPGTWMWAWNNVNGFPGSVLAAANWVRQKAGGRPELTTAEIPLQPDLPLRLALASMTLTHYWTYYSAPANPSTRVWLLLGEPGLALPEPSVTRVARVITEGVATMPITDHAVALYAYVRHRGFRYSAVPGGVRLELPDGSVTATVDEHRRLANVEARAGRAPTA